MAVAELAPLVLGWQSCRYAVAAAIDKRSIRFEALRHGVSPSFISTPLAGQAAACLVLARAAGAWAQPAEPRKA